ncbi:hypothetical protein KDD30_17510 (plasmid) [Photobacterium sp. GJ3]|uniref:hypothetical protein n=1 Tax=Photobacterium sp. GJ3 TaxID=2829502 RepID=UPI001B8CF246|nr:hypothetical protein [Photobacterium sp. GJ3]QUJ69956.1 hypothetical protein KDD30_17510 [Photobacterium sp. GJ3]
MLKKLILCIALLIAHVSFANNPINKPLIVNTTIDKSAFFAQEITRFSITPSQVVLRYDGSKKTFQDTVLQVDIETTFLVADTSLNLGLLLTNQFTVCRDNGGSGAGSGNELITPNDFLSVYSNDGISETKMELNTPVVLPQSSLDGETISSQSTLWMRFLIPPQNAYECGGSLTFTVEMDV